MQQQVIESKNKIGSVSVIIFLVLINLILIIRIFDRSQQKYELQTTLNDYNIKTPNELKHIIKLQQYLNDKTQTFRMKAMHNQTNVDSQDEEGVVYDRVRFGPFGWKTLHVYAANYPEQPNEAQQEKIKLFLQLFGEFFPCKECSQHFLDMLEEFPIQNQNRKQFRQYICKLHNNVNERLKKPIFDCSQHEKVYGNPKGCGCSAAKQSNEDNQQSQKEVKSGRNLETKQQNQQNQSSQNKSLRLSSQNKGQKTNEIKKENILPPIDNSEENDDMQTNNMIQKRYLKKEQSLVQLKQQNNMKLDILSNLDNDSV